MPANKKHLSSTGQRWLKTTAAIIGGYIVTMIIHNAIGIFLQNKAVVALTSAYSAFFMWVALMIWAFMSRNGWKIWGIYIGITAICAVLIVLFK